MNLPKYNPDGKKLTYFQHMEKLRKQQELEQQKLVENKGETPGRCPKCDFSRFSLKCGPERGVITRTCRNCGDERKF